MSRSLKKETVGNEVRRKQECSLKGAETLSVPQGEEVSVKTSLSQQNKH